MRNRIAAPHMTLQDFFDVLSRNPAVILFFFVALPLTAFLSSIFGKGEGHLSPWKYMYSILVYLACVPGIFAVTLNIYLFLFERQSVMEANLMTQCIPILVMIFTLALIRKNVAFDQIPGFGKISGLLMVIAAVLALMWFLDRTQIFAITFLPFYLVVIMLVALFVMIRYGSKQMFSSPKNP